MRSLVRYCSCHSNIKSISSRNRVTSSMYLNTVYIYPYFKICHAVPAAVPTVCDSHTRHRDCFIKINSPPVIIFIRIRCVRTSAIIPVCFVTIDCQMGRKFCGRLFCLLSQSKVMAWNYKRQSGLGVVYMEASYPAYPSLFVTMRKYEAMDDSSYRLNFDLGKKNEIHHYS